MQQPSAGHRNPQSPYSRAANQKTGGAQAAHVPMIEGTDLLKDPAATEALLEDKWAGGAGFAFIDSILGSRTNAAVNKVLADFVRQKIREAVDDPATAELLCPEETLTMGAKRHSSPILQRRAQRQQRQPWSRLREVRCDAPPAGPR